MSRHDGQSPSIVSLGLEHPQAPRVPHPTPAPRDARVS